VARQGFHNGFFTEIKINLFHVTGIGPQHGNFAPGQQATDNQTVEAVVIGHAAPNVFKRIAKYVSDIVHVNFISVVGA
jgi:hypothetical protein